MNKQEFPSNLIFQLLLISFFCISCNKTVTPSDNKITSGEYWRRQGLNQIIPFWQKNARDTINGAFYMTLSREGIPLPPWDKHPAMISREIFGFTAAYLLSGNEIYLTTAQEGAQYLLKHAWDKKYGGWYDVLDKSGNALGTTKSVPNQLYTNAGLTLYYFATGDSNVLSHVRESVRIQKERAFDSSYGGYFQILGRDLSVSDSSKSKHSHYGYTSSLLINLMMMTHENDIQDFAEELMQISFSHLIDSSYGWFTGFPSPGTRSWKMTPRFVNGREVVSAGAQLTASLSLLRLAELTGKKIYSEKGIALSRQVMSAAYDTTRGCWFDVFDREPPYKVEDTSSVAWWLQSYGILIQLHLYNLTGDSHYLESYRKMATFWDKYFVDATYGGVYQSVSPSGNPVISGKAVVWKASYHEMENALLNYLYLNLYVNHKPATLYFHLKNSDPQTRHYVSLAEDPNVIISRVKINGKNWSSFNAEEKYVNLPESEDIIMEVTLAYKTKHITNNLK
jgi:mannose/cellobiose epimerase-like protein (N-acyl-D-glucosamine 2-epimerase family)